MKWKFCTLFAKYLFDKRNRISYRTDEENHMQLQNVYRIAMNLIEILEIVK